MFLTCAETKEVEPTVKIQDVKLQSKLCGYYSTISHKLRDSDTVQIRDKIVISERLTSSLHSTLR